jgi:phytoene dehydrogenase-like protein
VHNIFFSDDYKAEFSDIFEKKIIHDDPTVYINITSKMNTTDAPINSENWFVMVNAPHNDNQNWDKIIQEARRTILKKISAVLKVDIESLIKVEHVLEPRLIESKTGSFKGALYGSSSNNRNAAFNRQPNFSKEHKGLYFCGGSVHPGGGIPLCLLSAKITADLIEKDAQKN